MSSLCLHIHTVHTYKRIHTRVVYAYTYTYTYTHLCLTEQKKDRTVARQVANAIINEIDQRLFESLERRGNFENKVCILYVCTVCMHVCMMYDVCN